MIIWNTSKVMLEGMFDGQIYEFAPMEKKRIFNPDVVNHLIFKLSDYGLVSYPDELEAEKNEQAIQKHFIEGLRNRRKMLDSRVRNFRTMNKEREAAKMSAEQPTDLIVDTVKEIKAIDEELAKLKKDDYAMVSEYMGTQPEEEAQTAIDETNRGVQSNPDLSVSISGKESLASEQEEDPKPQTGKLKGTRRKNVSV